MTRTPAATRYDEDYFVWTQEQAAALRRAGALAPDIDIEHVAEEIEDLGKRDLREVRSFLRLLVVHLLEIAACPDAPSVRHWRTETWTFNRSARDAFTPGMRQRLDMGSIWREAAQDASRSLREAGVAFVAPADCPLSLDEVLEGFDLDAALAKVKAAMRRAGT